MPEAASSAQRLQFRDPERARRLVRALAERTRGLARAPVSLMHVCGSHEQAIARFGLRASLPARAARHHGARLPGLHHGRPRGGRGGGAGVPGRARRHLRRHAARAGSRRVAGRRARGRGARTRRCTASTRRSSWRAAAGEEVVFFASGFETTAVATAAAMLDGLPPNLSVLSAHKYIPPVMEIVAEMPGNQRRGLPRRRACGDDHGLRRLRALRRAAPGCRWWWPASSRSTSWPGSSSSSSCSRPAARRGERLPALRHPRGQPARPAGALARVPPDRRALARHRARAERQPAPARRVGARRRAPPLRDRRRGPARARAREPRRGLPLRRHHGGHRVAHRLPAVRLASARPRTRSAPAWCRARAPAASGTSTAAIRTCAAGKPACEGEVAP